MTCTKYSSGGLYVIYKLSIIRSLAQCILRILPNSALLFAEDLQYVPLLSHSYTAFSAISTTSFTFSCAALLTANWFSAKISNEIDWESTPYGFGSFSLHFKNAIQAVNSCFLPIARNVLKISWFKFRTKLAKTSRFRPRN